MSSKPPDQAPPEPFDPSREEFRRDPYGQYAKLRTLDPVHWSPPPRPGVTGCWYVSRHPDVVSLLKDPRARRELPPPPAGTAGGEPDAFSRLKKSWLVLRDPPHHTRLRAAVSGAFTAERLRRLRPRVEAFADELLEPIESGREVDLMATFAVPFTVEVIGEVIGVPRADRGELARWAVPLVAAIDRTSTGAAHAEAVRASEEFSDYLETLVVERRGAGGEDLIAQLTEHMAAGKLSKQELIANCVLLLVAGHDTTANLIGNGLLALLDHPGQLRRLREEPDLVAGAVEELLRFNGPSQLGFRFVAEEIEMRGRQIPAGSGVCFLLGSANHDPEVFDRPEELDLGRPAGRHLSFGHGIHYCVGADLARLEAQVALAALLRHFRRLEAAFDEPEWRRSVFVRGLVRLPVVCHR